MKEARNAVMDEPAVTTLRAELACAFRWAARLQMHEATANHFSAAVNDDGTEFLINPQGRHFSEIRASDLVQVNGRADAPPEGLDPTAWAIHSAIHRNNPTVRCVLHTHAPNATALACLDNPRLPAIDQNAMRFFERVIIDQEFGGMGLGGEAERLSGLVAADKPIVLLASHGVITLGECVAQAFDDLYYFERACDTWLRVLATGQSGNVVDPEVARLTARQWQEYPDFARHHFGALTRILDREEPDYRQ